MDFKYFLFKKNLSLRTINRHIMYADKVLQSCPDFSFNQIDQFFISLKEKGCKNTYLNHIIPSIRYYAEFKGLTGYSEKYKYLNEETYVSATMSDQEIESFLSLPIPKNYARRAWDFWTVFFSIMAFTGLRPGEVGGLTINDVDFGLDVIHVSSKEYAKGKTKASIADVPLPENIRQLLKDYIEQLTGENLFQTPRNGNNKWGSVVSTNNWTPRFHQRLKILGIKRSNLTTYSLRHSYATALGDAEVNVRVIQELMRHSSILTTMHYMHPGLKAKRKGQNKLPLIMKSINPLGLLESVKETVEGSGILTDSRISADFRKRLIELFFEEAERLRL